MRVRLASLVVVVLACVGLIGPPAAARQMRVRSAPRVSGPLDPRAIECVRNTERVEGEIIAVARSCVRFYTLEPSAEGDPTRDYGVIWLQTSLRPRGRWCAIAARSDIRIPTRRVHARRPRTRAVHRRHEHLTRLVVDAAGQATDPATVSKRFVLYPEEMRARTRNEGRSFRLAWHGSTGRRVAFATGVEISWHKRYTPRDIDSRFGYEVRRSGRC